MTFTTAYKPNLPALRRILSILAVVFAVPTLFFWSQEIWQRPVVLLRVDERWLFNVSAGGMLFAVIAWPGRRRRGFWWKRAVLGGVIIASTMGAAYFTGRDSAVEDLKQHRALTGSNEFIWPPTDQRLAWLLPVREWLEDRGVPVPTGHRAADPVPYSISEEPIEHLVETSRWQVRHEFMRDMMRDENRAAYLVYEWHRWFPAVTGQDVTLARRSEMIEWLETLADDSSAAKTSRDAATFWIGLIVLTDVDAFAYWRVLVRDAMLACDDPPMCHSGDVWIRVLDVLLAFDSRDETVALTRKLLREPTLLRRALRERVRGMAGHMQPIMDEIERQDALGIVDVPMAMWVDLRHLADHQPDSPERTEVRQRLRGLIAVWLVEDAVRVRKRFGSDRFGANIVADVILEMPDEIRSSLAGHAHGILEGVGADPGEDPLPAAIQQALMIPERNPCGWKMVRTRLNFQLLQPLAGLVWPGVT